MDGSAVVSVRVTIELLEMLDLHDNLLAGPTGRKVNGAGAGALVEYLHLGRIQGIGFLAGAPGSDQATKAVWHCSD